MPRSGSKASIALISASEATCSRSSSGSRPARVAPGEAPRQGEIALHQCVTRGTIAAAGTEHSLLFKASLGHRITSTRKGTGSESAECVERRAAFSTGELRPTRHLDARAERRSVAIANGFWNPSTGIRMLLSWQAASSADGGRGRDRLPDLYRDRACQKGAWGSPRRPSRTPGGIVADEQRDVIEVLEHDHREVEEMFAELESLRGASTEEARRRRKDVAEQVTIELVRHSVAEEVLVYPKVQEKVSVEEAKRAREEHAEAEETMQRLERLDADYLGFDAELATLMRGDPPSHRRRRGRDVRAHAAGHRRRRAARAGSRASRPSRRSPRPGHTRWCRTPRCRAWRRAPRRRCWTGCATSRPIEAAATELVLRPVGGGVDVVVDHGARLRRSAAGVLASPSWSGVRPRHPCRRT